MNLRKSKTGKALIVLYYAVFGTGAFLLMMFIIIKVGILAGLAAGFALGIICGIIGGELEFIEHRKTLRKERGVRKKTEEPGKVIAFP